MNQSSAAVSPRRKTTSYRRQNDRPQSTPFQHWKFHDNKPTGGFEASARKLAAGLWQLRFREISWGQELNSGPDDHSQPRFELESSIPCPKFVLERATKWDHCCSKASEQFYPFYLKNCQVTTVSMVSTLNDELMQARLCIRELQAKRKSFKKKVKHLLGKLEEERILRKCRERQKDQGVIEFLMKELGRERSSRQRIKNLNTSLVSRLANAKLSADRFMKTYEEERKNRRFMEQVCNELAEHIGENRAELKALKRESLKIIDELEGERKMLQIAEVWREERIQMKLIDAKLALEDKYHQVNKLITDVETFLRSRFATLDMLDLRKAELILQEVKSLNIQEIGEFSYVPSKSDDIFSTFEELRPYEGREREINPFICHSTSSHDSKFHLASPSIDRVGQCRHVSRSGSECNDNAGQSSPDTEIIEVCSVSEHQPKQKPSYMSKLWRSCPTNGEFYKVVLDEDKRRLSNGITSSVGTNADRRMIEHEIRHRDSDGHLFPPDIANSRITRGTKGCIAWPRAM
ncbi:hypothetical protein M0R45_012914 [Rubus argutus]|uniref:Uncharacterized protein n=1 Tax=Rubus argutus TaxID=59490 RepID=A0AAW1XIA5_RUBAR